MILPMTVLTEYETTVAPRHIRMLPFRSNLTGAEPQESADYQISSIHRFCIDYSTNSFSKLKSTINLPYQLIRILEQYGSFHIQLHIYQYTLSPTPCNADYSHAVAISDPQSTKCYQMVEGGRKIFSRILRTSKQEPPCNALIRISDIQKPFLGISPAEQAEWAKQRPDIPLHQETLLLRKL